MHRSTRWISTAALAAAVVLMLVAVAGCGDDDTDGGNGASAAAAASDGDFTGREAEINETLIGIQDDFDKLDGSSYCDRLTAAGQREVERFGKAFAIPGDCSKIIDTVAKNTRTAGVKQKPTKLISVEFKGNQAIATVRNGGRPPEPMLFVNDNGDWKIPKPGFKPTFGGDPNAKPLSSDPQKRLQQLKRSSDAANQ